MGLQGEGWETHTTLDTLECGAGVSQLGAKDAGTWDPGEDCLADDVSQV